MHKQKITVSVIGARVSTPKTAKLANAVGRMVAEAGCILVCGGLLGLMRESCRGAKEAGGGLRSVFCLGMKRQMLMNLLILRFQRRSAIHAM